MEPRSRRSAGQGRARHSLCHELRHQRRKRQRRAIANSPDLVPSNKRLVIEFVSLSVSAQPGDQPSVFLNDSVNDYGHAYWIPLTLAHVARSGVEVWRASQLVKLYHDSPRTFGPGAQCMRNVNSSAPRSCHITLSGYLVDK